MLTLTSASTSQLQQKHLLQPTTEAVTEVEAAQPTVAGKFIRSHRRTSHRETERERERIGAAQLLALPLAALLLGQFMLSFNQTREPRRRRHLFCCFWSTS